MSPSQAQFDQFHSVPAIQCQCSACLVGTYALVMHCERLFCQKFRSLYMFSHSQRRYQPCGSGTCHRHEGSSAYNVSVHRPPFPACFESEENALYPACSSRAAQLLPVSRILFLVQLAIPTTMGKEPLNIIKLKQQNDMFSAAESHANNLRIANCEAVWHHRDFCKAPASGSVPNTKVCCHVVVHSF